MRPIEVLDRGAAAHPTRACLVSASTTLSYEELRHLTCRIAQRLQKRGFAQGHHAAVLAPNDVLGFACALAAHRAGLTWLPVNARDSARSIGEQLNRFDADILFVHSSFSAAVSELQSLAPRIREVVVYDTQLDSWIANAKPEALGIPEDPQATVAIFATSGTTGQAKGVELSELAFEVFINAFETINPHGDVVPVYLAAAPLTHVSGRICLAGMGAGGTTVILERATPEVIVAALAEHAVTIVFLPPTAIYALLALPGIADVALPALKYLGYGSAPMRVEATKKALEVFGPVLVQGYGQTEAPMLITSMSTDEHLVDGAPAPDERLSSVGRATPFTTLELMDADDLAVAHGEVGEVCVRGDYLMTRYYKEPDATSEVFRNGWHHTGDLGYLDGDDYLHLVDRRKDMIITGGFNVYSAEVERILGEHSEVAEAAVVGVPDDRWGELVSAVVVPAPGHKPDPDAIIDHARNELGSVKAPKRVEIWDALPRNATGKVLKAKIRGELSSAADDHRGDLVEP